jgi:hypothetical protein
MKYMINHHRKDAIDHDLCNQFQPHRNQQPIS